MESQIISVVFVKQAVLNVMEQLMLIVKRVPKVIYLMDPLVHPDVWSVNISLLVNVPYVNPNVSHAPVELNALLVLQVSTFQVNNVSLSAQLQHTPVKLIGPAKTVIQAVLLV